MEYLDLLFPVLISILAVFVTVSSCSTGGSSRDMATPSSRRVLGGKWRSLPVRNPEGSHQPAVVAWWYLVLDLDLLALLILSRLVLAVASVSTNGLMKPRPAGAYITSLYMMVDIVKGGGRAPPPLSDWADFPNIRQKVAIATLCVL
jgi:hypothetical protein